jgi:hypothetical protein
MSIQPPVRERWATWNGHEPEAQPPRIVAFDIETTSLKADIGFVLCAVVKPLDDEPIILRLDDLRGDSGKPWDDSVPGQHAGRDPGLVPPGLRLEHPQVRH